MKQKVDMLEPLMASLLTLDWEISSQTIGKYEKELQRLKEKLGNDPYSKKLIDLCLPICDYLRIRRGSAAPSSMQFLHKATRILYHFRQTKKLTADEHRETIKKLCSKYKTLTDDVNRVNRAMVQARRLKSAPGTKAAAKTPAKKRGAPGEPTGQKVGKMSPTAAVLRTIKKHKKGIDIAALKEITGVTDSNVRTIVYRAAKEGKIKRVSRGVYAAA